MPLISVIVPVYKVEKYINRCVDSILNQTLKNFELILIDDGSPDNCGRICDEYAEKDKRIRVIHQENGGISAARNTGINWASEHSGSEWLTFIDSDDWVHEQYLELLYNAVDGTGCNVSMCGFQETEGAVQKVSNESTEIECWEMESLFCTYAKNATVAWGKLYRKSYFETINYPVGKMRL